MKGLRKLADAELEAAQAGLFGVARDHFTGCADCRALAGRGYGCDEFEALLALRSDLGAEGMRRFEREEADRERVAEEGA